MKKSLLLTALIASVASLAATTGTVELEVKNEMKAEKVNEVLTENKTSAKLKSEVKVAKSGFSFGTELGLKELTLFELGGTTHTTFNGFQTLKEKNDGSKVWAKYELPEFKGFHSSVKAEYDTPTKDTNNKIKAELDANYEIKNKATLGYNTTYELELGKKVESDSVLTTQKVYLNVTNPKFVNSKLEAEFKHDWQSEKKADKKLPEPIFKKSVKDIRGEAALNYKVLNNLVLGGEAYIKYINFIDDDKEGEYRNFLTGKNDDKFTKGAKHIGTGAVALNLTYEKDKLKLENKVFLQNIFELKDTGIDRDNFGIIKASEYNGKIFETHLAFHYGTNIKATYTAIDNLTLTADTTFGGKSKNIVYETTLTKKGDKFKRELNNVNTDKNDGVDEKATPKVFKTDESKHTQHAGYVKVALGAKYDYELIKTVTLTPELNVKVEASELKSPLAKKRSANHFGETTVGDVTTDYANYNFVSLEITPKLSVAYKPISKFTVSANAELPITLDNKNNDKRDKFEFKNVQIKPSVNVKYEW
ncbi:hypothetical protein [Sneathia sanguinegens]|uniref:hypothetical protein n=1 Tax=Sneathia sanguinegens TaxID=40543 RepID=UPI00258F88E3|nr:hypothetical protein [Sneathia sanguinegens]MDU4652630.1 hypothetical protein [Sneathia sanguinegens]